MLIGHVGKDDNEDRCDERMRAAFAPTEAVLDPTYEGSSLDFFELCRGTLAANAKRMAEWVIVAEGKQRHDALVYLADGRLGVEVQNAICLRGYQDTWLAQLRSSTVFREISVSQQHRLAQLLGPSRETLAQTGPDRSKRAVSPGDTLHRIHAWWSQERVRRMPDYLCRVYPGGIPDVCVADGANDGQTRDKAWVVLFFLGMTYTMGRAKYEAHRNFLAECERKKWLDVFAAEDADPSSWLAILDQYNEARDDDNRFLQWMKQFVGIRAVSRHLNDYRDAFLSIDRFTKPFRLTAVTMPRVSPVFDRGGVDAPSIARILGIGACFVVRELVRLGMVRNGFAYPHCYVPTLRVRQLFDALGCDDMIDTNLRWEVSRTIDTFVRNYLGEEEATFNYDFDIPFQIIAESPELRHRFFADTTPGSEDDSDY